MAETSVPPAVVDGLALALVTASSVPVLLLDGTLTVIAASTSFCAAFQIDPNNVAERELSELGRGEWDNAQLRGLLRATISGQARVAAYEMDLKRKDREPRRLVMNAVTLDSGDPQHVRILLTISDVTNEIAAEALREKLAVEKTVLLKEIQHRVANSLQIIASVLMQSARKVQSEESRGHLENAHHRVLSIAAVQKRLVGTGSDEVEILPYFKQLCESLGDSMIHDPRHLSLTVEADDSTRNADDSMALGLIVTELVINALKHAFPDHRSGAIKVIYASRADSWTLSVSDNGIGMRLRPGKPGLGTSIVEALSRQLQAEHIVRSGDSGTTVSVARKLGLAVVAQAVH